MRIPFANIGDVRPVEMPGDDQIHPAAFECFEGHFRSRHESPVAGNARRPNEGMVRQDDLQRVFRECLEDAFRTQELPPAEAARFDGERTDGIEAEDAELPVEMNGAQLPVDEIFVAGERSQETMGERDRNIVVSRNDDGGLREPCEKCAGALELPQERPPREVAADDGERGAESLEFSEERFLGSAVDLAEVEIGNMGDFLHMYRATRGEQRGIVLDECPLLTEGSIINFP